MKVRKLCFDISEIEEQNMRNFEEKHSKCKNIFEYMLSLTALGSVIRMKCVGCGEEEDVTDYTGCQNDRR